MTGPAHNPSLPNEDHLVQQLAAGNWDAYTQLFTHYLPRLSHYIYPFVNRSTEDMEDLIQDIFLTIWERRQTFVAIRSFEHYLFRMARNRLIDIIRRKQTGRRYQQYYRQFNDATHSQPENDLQYAEYHTAALQAINRLSPKLKQVFLMSSQHDMSLDQIAEQLNLPKPTVKKRLYLATLFIRNYLRKYAAWFLIWLGS